MPDASVAAGDDPRDIVVLVAHPSLELSRANRRLRDAAQHASPRIEVRDLYRLYPDYLVDVRLEQALSSDTARVEDRFEATTAVDLRENNRVVIPAGSRVRGVITGVKNAGRVERNELSLQRVRVEDREADRSQASALIRRVERSVSDESAEHADFDRVHDHWKIFRDRCALHPIAAARIDLSDV